MPNITLSMIVKNEESTLPRCLKSVQGVADEIVIVDTGSTDRTIEIAKSFNAKVFHFDWNNDFSAARNFALKNSNGDFILYMDADEELSHSSKNLIQILSQKKERIGYLCTIKSLDDYSKQPNSIRYVRFFRNSPCLRFSGKVHEQITDSLIENHYEIIHSDIEIIHHGYNISKDEKKLKAERNLKLLLDDYQSNSTSYVAFQIAQSYFILESFDEADKYFNLCLTSKSLSKDFQAESYSYLAQLSHNRLDINQSETYIKRAISLSNQKPFYHYLLAKILQRRQDYKGSLKSFRDALNFNDKIIQSSKNSLQITYLNKLEVIYSALNLALKSQEINQLKYFIDELQKETKKNFPNHQKAYNFFIDLIIKPSTLTCEIFNEIEEIISNDNLEIVLQIIDTHSDISLKYNLFEKLSVKFPTEIEILKRLALLQDALGSTDKALLILEENFEKITNDPPALFFLASFHIKKNNFERTIELFDLIENKFPNLLALNSKIKEIKEKIIKISGKS